MEKKRKILIVIAIIICVFIVLLIGIILNNKKDNYKIESGSANEEVVIKNISAKITNIEYKNNISYITVELKNISKKEVEIDAIKIYLYDDNNNEIINFVDFVDKTIKPGENIDTYAILDILVENAKYVSYEILKEDN